MNYTRKSEKTFQGKHALKLNSFDKEVFFSVKNYRIK